MATKTIAKSGGDYSTIAAWESDTDNDLVTAAEGEIGEMEDDGTDWDETNVLLGATVNATYFRTLRAKEGHRHSGVAGDGVVKTTSAVGHCFSLDEDYFVIEGLQIDNISTSGAHAFRVRADECLVDLCIVHDFAVSNQCGVFAGDSTARNLYVRNCIFYDIARSAVLIDDKDNQIIYVHNCTAYNGNTQNDATVPTVGLIVNKTSTGSVMHCTNVTAHAANRAAFNGHPTAGEGECRCENCASHDDSADGSGGQNVTDVGNNNINVTQADQFVSLTGGSEDFHLKSSGTTLEDAGADLSSDSDLAVTLDIDYATRSGTYDIGADELTAATTDDVETPYDQIYDVNRRMKSRAVPY